MSPHGPPQERLNAVIMGAAFGDGRWCAEWLAQAGVSLLLGDFEAQALSQVSVALGATGRFCDVASKSSVAIFANEVTKLVGVPDILINAAGSGYIRTLGMIRMTGALLPAMRRSSTPMLVLSLESERSNPVGLFAYAASQTGFAGTSKAIADNVRGSSIEVVSASRKDASLVLEEFVSRRAAAASRARQFG